MNKSKDAPVHGILVQLPLPGHIDAARILHSVSPLKDVDAFHPENVGLIVQGRPRFLPCTPYGIQQLLVRNRIEIAGKHVVVVGRSDIVGKPMANMLLQRGAGADATVTTDRAALNGLVLRETPFADAVANGVVRVDGDAGTVARLFSLLDDFPLMFEVVEPKRQPVAG